MAGLKNALALLAPIKEKFPLVSYADLFQMASAVAVEIVSPFASLPHAQLVHQLLH